jgi:Ca2+-binding EF-hand superfamily protein
MKKMTRNVLLGMSLTATAFAGAAYAKEVAGGDGVTTRAEVEARSAAMFERMDVNKDGKLDQADREARRAAQFDRLDTDKNGQLSRAEFNARPQHNETKASTATGEGGKHHRWGGRGHGHHGGMMMGRMADANKDGAITKAEFTAAALQRFDQMDTNKDGQVTKEERQAAHKAMRDEWRAKREAAPAATPKN